MDWIREALEDLGLFNATNSLRDPEGYDAEGYDAEGYDREGYHRITNFNRDGIHRETGTKFNPKGFDVEGYNAEGYNAEGYDREGLNRRGFDKKGFDRQGLNSRGYDKEGYDAEGYDKNGFNRDGINRETQDIYDAEGYDSRGFDKDGIHKITKTPFDERGYDRTGFNERGIHRETRAKIGPDGYNKYGFNLAGIHRDTHEKYDPEGFDWYGFDAEGYNREGYNRNGLDREGFDKSGFNKDGIHKNTNTEYDLEGYKKDGFNAEGVHRDTKTKFNPEGYDIEGYNEQGYDRMGFNRAGYDEQGYDINDVNKDGINRDTGEKDVRIEFVERFIDEGVSIEQFARIVQMTPQEAERVITEVRESPCIKARLNRALRKNSDTFIRTTRAKKDQLVSGKISVRDVGHIDTILRLASKEEKKVITEMLMKEVSTHSITMSQYKSIFGIGNVGAQLPQEVLNRTEEMFRSAKNIGISGMSKLARDIRAEMDRIRSYRKPYIPSEGEKMGFLENPSDKEAKMVEITDEHRTLARQYLRVSGEYICQKTMSLALMKVIKGEITPERMVRLEKENRLRALQHEKGELDEVESMAKQVMQENKQKEAPEEKQQ